MEEEGEEEAEHSDIWARFISEFLQIPVKILILMR